MPVNHADITDARGRHIPVVKRRIESTKRAIDGDIIPPNGPRDPKELAHRLDALASRVSRLSPDHRRPERFFEDKSEIVRELAKLATWAARG